MTENIFISESDELGAIRKKLFKKLDIDTFESISEEIFRKKYNNKVGYLIFKSHEKLFKIFVLPKHINSTPLNAIEEQEISKEFVDYLKIHYVLQQKYTIYKNDTSVNSITKLALDGTNNLESTQNIEYFIFYRYETLLLNIKKFFSSHKSMRKELTGYTSQTIKYKFDLAKNIKEFDKTKIHQIRHKHIIYSDIAKIVYAAIKLFMNSKIELLGEHVTQKKTLMKLSKEIQLLLCQKFNVDSSNRITLSQLLSTKTYKLFKKKQSFLQLYANTLSLFGIENILDDGISKEVNNITSEALFVDPALLYEWYVYDVLSNSSYVLEKDFSIAFDKNEGTNKGYHIKGDYKRTTIASNPDFILTKDKDIYVIDAKWKVINDLPIDLNDMLKLKRDAETRSLEGNVYAVLIYFSIGEDRAIQEFLHNEINPTFSFYATQISFTHNSLNLEQFEQVAIKMMVIDDLAKDFLQVKHSTYQNLVEIDLEEKDISNLIDNQLIQQVEKFGQAVRQYYSEQDMLEDEYCQQFQVFLDNNKDILEVECISFIESATSTTFYFNKFVDAEKHFDYSMPSSGIWKSIEVELNASIIFILRYLSNVCSKEKYYFRREGSSDIHIRTGPKRNQMVFLTNTKKIPDRMDNILLGSFPYILKNIIQGHTFDHQKTLKTFEPIFEKYYSTSYVSISEWANSIIDFLFYVVNIRNPHTHKDLMEQVTYNSFIDYIFCNNDFNYTDLIQLKRNIIEYINEMPS